MLDPLKLPDPDFRIPDCIGWTEGWRSWSVSGEYVPYLKPKLWSVIHDDHYWVPRRAFEVVCTCKKHIKDADGPPCERGRCGLYSAKTREHLLSMSYHTYDGDRNGSYCVIGRVANWGKLVEGSLGWRSQFSYPVELFVPYEIWKQARPLEQAYGCRVRLDNFLKEEAA
jgi:hypothetical protein